MVRNVPFVGLTFGLVAIAQMVTAEPAGVASHLAWSTYLRAGPSSAASVIDELFHDTAVTVSSCGPQWCQVRVGRTVGYVDRDALALPRPPQATASQDGAANCVTAGLNSYNGKAPVRFCAAPGAPAVR